MKVELNEDELAYLSRSIFGHRIDSPEDDAALASQLDPKISVARMRAHEGGTGGMNETVRATIERERRHAEQRLLQAENELVRAQGLVIEATVTRDQCAEWLEALDQGLAEA